VLFLVPALVDRDSNPTDGTACLPPVAVMQFDQATMAAARARMTWSAFLLSARRSFRIFSRVRLFGMLFSVDRFYCTIRGGVFRHPNLPHSSAIDVPISRHPVMGMS
jgi:hypothetical protein